MLYRSHPWVEVADRMAHTLHVSKVKSCFFCNMAVLVTNVSQPQGQVQRDLWTVTERERLRSDQVTQTLQQPSGCSSCVSLTVASIQLQQFWLALTTFQASYNPSVFISSHTSTISPHAAFELFCSVYSMALVLPAPYNGGCDYIYQTSLALQCQWRSHPSAMK